MFYIDFLNALANAILTMEPTPLHLFPEEQPLCPDDLSSQATDFEGDQA